MTQLSLRPVVLAAVTALAASTSLVFADEVGDRYAATLADIKATLGTVPDSFSRYPKGALPGAWQALKALELSGDTALPAKVKDLIGLAVAAQIPCSYCIYVHTEVPSVTGQPTPKSAKPSPLPASRATGAPCSTACRSISPRSRRTWPRRRRNNRQRNVD